MAGIIVLIVISTIYVNVNEASQLFTNCEYIYHRRQTPAGRQEEHLQCDDTLKMKKIDTERGYIIDIFDNTNNVLVANVSSGVRISINRHHSVQGRNVFVDDKHDAMNYKSSNCLNADQLLQLSDGRAISSFNGEAHFGDNYFVYLKMKCNEIQQFLHQLAVRNISDKASGHGHHADSVQALFSFKQPAQWSHISEHESRLPNDRLSRSRRSLIVPGTNWCGVGNVSSANQTYGSNVGVDRCCHEHDRCEHTVEGFSTNYRLFNFRFHTISHCECDDRFRTCLRALANEEADRIGHWFFNVIGMRCFVFQRERVCSERNWWGKCLQYKFEYRAELHSNAMSY